MKTLPLWLAALAALLLARPAYAHRLDAEARVLSEHIVAVESWFETGDTPQEATVQVFRADGSLLIKGPLDAATGKFLFRYERPEPLRIVVLAPGGHRAEVKLFEDAAPSSFAGKDLLIGLVLSLTLLLAVAAVVVRVRAARKSRAGGQTGRAEGQAPSAPSAPSQAIRAPGGVKRD
jgi:hypothetical protein